MAQAAADQKKQENVQSWIKEGTDKLTQRSFNINEIMGNFERDWSGQIVNREHVLRQNHFRDREGMVVNEKGYLIDATTGDVRSRYTFEVVFKNHEITCRTRCDLPLPYRLESYNFNPHHCFGNFDFDDKQNPIILKDKNGIRIDKNLRHVNSVGWLIDKYGNIVDN